MPKKFEWYYFDLHSEDGYDLVFTLHSRPFMTQFAVAIFDIFLYKDNALLEHRFFTLPAKDLREEKPEALLWFNDNNFIAHKQNVIKAIAAKDDIRLDMELIPVAGNPGAFRYDLLGAGHEKRKFIWRLFAPRCMARVKLSLGDKIYELQGQGYHDYNGGDVFLKKALKGWRWSKIYVEDKLFIIGEIMPRNASVHKILVVPDKNNLQHSADFYFSERAGKLILKSHIAGLDILIEKKFQIDNIRFLTLQPATLLQYPAMVYEILTAVSLQYGLLKPLSRLLTNARYVRRRLLGKSVEGVEVQVFQEEIFF